MASIPPAEVSIDAALVTRLLAAQCPRLAGRSVARFGNGWDNELYSLGEDLLVRLPRRQAAAALIEHEIAALPRLADSLPVPVPVPVFAGWPGEGYPWRWTVVPRLPGGSAASMPPAGRGRAAGGLAAFLTAVHRPAAPEAPANPFRGVPLAARADQWTPRICQVAGVAASDSFQRAAAAPVWPGPPVWLHGDPHPLNLLLAADGTLVAVIDFGDVCSGDPASDLASAWLMFDAPARARFRAECDRSGGYDAAIWTRAWAWALGLSVTFLLSSDDSPELAAIARHGLAQTLADPGFSRAG